MGDSSAQHNEHDGIDINLIRAEINAEADQWRRQDPEITLLERKIEQEWLDIAPLGAVIKDERLVDRFETLGQIKVDAPAEPRLHLRQIKKVILRAILWYIQYLVGQINGLLKLLARNLRYIDSRLDDLERTTGLHAGEIQLYDATLEPSPETGDIVASLVNSRYCAVLSCGDGGILDAIYKSGGSGYGIELDNRLVSNGIRRGLDVRLGCIMEHITTVEDNSLEAIVLANAVERKPIGVLVKLYQEVERALSATGIVVIAVADLEKRSGAEKELLVGCGLSPHTWQYFMDQNGFNTQLVETSESRVSTLVLARRS